MLNGNELPSLMEGEGKNAECGLPCAGRLACVRELKRRVEHVFSSSFYKLLLRDVCGKRSSANWWQVGVRGCKVSTQRIHNTFKAGRRTLKKENGR